MSSVFAVPRAEDAETTEASIIHGLEPATELPKRRCILA